jgi:hypothetical protein
MSTRSSASSGPDYHPEDLGPVPEVYTPFQLDPDSSDQGHYFVPPGASSRRLARTGEGALRNRGAGIPVDSFRKGAP